MSTTGSRCNTELAPVPHTAISNMMPAPLTFLNFLFSRLTHWAPPFWGDQDLGAWAALRPAHRGECSTAILCPFGVHCQKPSKVTFAPRWLLPHRQRRLHHLAPDTALVGPGSQDPWGSQKMCTSQRGSESLPRGISPWIHRRRAFVLLTFSVIAGGTGHWAHPQALPSWPWKA